MTSPAVESVHVLDTDDEAAGTDLIGAATVAHLVAAASDPKGGAGASASSAADEVTNSSSISPWMNDAGSTAMLLDPAPDRDSTDMHQLAFQEPTTTTIVRRSDREPPMDLNTGPFASHLPLQVVNAHGRRVSQDEPAEDRLFRTGLVYSSVMMLHAVPSFIEEDSDSLEHPEKPERISIIFHTLKMAGCVARMKRIPIRDVTMDEIKLIHRKDMWDGVERTAFFTTNTLATQTRSLEASSSLYVNEHSARCARLSCGGVIEMCDAVASGRVQNGFALVRPPGHHAEPNKSMGFCFYNNVAVAARFVQEKYGEACRKILIIDWDVHHGNGTQSAFWEDESILYISIHRYDDGDFFPGGKAGDFDQIGEGKGIGKNVNIPWPQSGMRDADYMAAFQRIVMPIASEFGPDLVVISAGFDAAEGDELGLCHVSPTGYAQMTHDLASLAHGKVVAALEGGYNLDSIAKSALSVTQVLLGEAPPPVDAGLACSLVAEETLDDVRRVQSQYWKSIEAPYGVPVENEDEGLERYGWAETLALHRIYSLGQRYDLDALPVIPSISALSLRGHDLFSGQILCSSGLFEAKHNTLVFFAHDAGTLRIEPKSVNRNLVEELGYIVDGSSLVIDWARNCKAGLVDVNLNAQIPDRQPGPVVTTTRRGRNGTASKKVAQIEKAKQILLYAWDNAAVMVLASNPQAKIVLIGLGTATEAVMSLIEERKVEANVACVIQLPAYNQIPTVSKNSLEKRIWYYRRSRVYLPREHAYYTLDAQARAGKRLGKVFRSDEDRAIQVLRKEFSSISSFMQQAVSSQ